MPEPSLHHVGYVVPSIAESLARWSATLSVVSVSDPFDDEIQRARVVFLQFASGGTTLELVEPLPGDSPVLRFLQKGGGLHHLCFEVDDLEEHIRLMKTHQALLLRKPQPAIAFGGRHIAWMVTRDKLLTEYLERPRPQLQ
ncbi:MAG: VOC family protein [Acidobacteriota bacterium]